MRDDKKIKLNMFHLVLIELIQICICVGYTQILLVRVNTKYNNASKGKMDIQIATSFSWLRFLDFLSMGTL